MIDARTGDILTSFDSNPVNILERKKRIIDFFQHLTAPHDIAVSSNGREVYVGELALSSANALHKFEMAKRKGEIVFLYFVNLISFYLYRSSDTNIQ
jgi:hypothetical protein